MIPPRRRISVGFLVDQQDRLVRAFLAFHVAFSFAVRNQITTGASAPKREDYSCLDDLSALNGRSLRRRCAPGLPLLLGFLYWPRPRGRRSTWVRLRSAPDCEPVTTTTEPNGGNSTDQFHLNDIRLYVNGPVTKTSNSCSIPTTTASPTSRACWTRWRRLRWLPSSTSGSAVSCRPATARTCTARSTRNEWKVYTDGIQDGYPSVFQGRDNGVAVLGRLRQESESLGRRASMARSATGNPKFIGAARVQIDFWDPEDGYYLNGTYYGDKNLLAIGGARSFKTATPRPPSISSWKRKCPTAARLRLKASIPTTTGWAGMKRRMPRARASTGWQLPVSEEVRSALRQVRDSRQICQGRFHARDRLPATTRKPPKFNFNYVIKQFNARVHDVLREHKIQQGDTEFLAGGNRPPDPDVTLNRSQSEIQSE